MKDNYINVKCNWLKMFGPDKAVWLSNLFNWEANLIKQKHIEKGEYFFIGKDKIQNVTGLSLGKQTQIIKFFTDTKIIAVSKRGVPAKNHYSIRKRSVTSESINLMAVNPVYNNTINRITNILFSKENNKSTSREEVRSVNKEIPSKEQLKTAGHFISYWNSLESVPKFRNKKSKRYYKAITLICELLWGNFKKGKYFDPVFLKEKEIPDRWLRQRWSRSKVETVLFRMSQLYLKGYWPHDKSRLPKSLVDLIYNERAGTSFFLNLAKKPLETLNKGISDDTPRLTERFLKYLGVTSLTPSKMKTLLYNIKALSKFRGAIPKDKYNKRNLHFGTDVKFINTYVLWLDKNQWITSNVSVSDPEGGVFNRFIDDKQKELGIKLRK